MQNLATEDHSDVRTPGCVCTVEQHQVQILGIGSIRVRETHVFPEFAGAVRRDVAAEERQDRVGVALTVGAGLQRIRRRRLRVRVIVICHGRRPGGPTIGRPDPCIEITRFHVTIPAQPAATRTMAVRHTSCITYVSIPQHRNCSSRLRRTGRLLAQPAYNLGMSAITPEARKDARIAMRLTPSQDALIRDAAAATGQSLTQFVTTAALAHAEDALADRRVFRLDDAAWAEFTALLDRPAEHNTALAELLHLPAPWDK